MDTQAKEEQTFTQAELDQVVKDRLKREKERYADYDEVKARASEADAAKQKAAEAAQAAKNESEKAKALQAEIDTMKAAEALRVMREGVSRETGVPVNLLTSESAEGCKAQAEAILSFARPGYPSLKDGGEVQNTEHKKSTRELFAEYAKEKIGG